MKNRGQSSGLTARRYGIISVVCGVLGLWIIGVVLGLVAIIVGLTARKAGGGLLAVVGISLGVLDIVALVLHGSGWNSSGYASIG
ncbi:MAG: hypothetical protein ACQSGP_01270 [Frankia sp.]